ncbi:DELLA protein RGL2-like [Pistacia vera]|uniref:DELLA protein RGL2-like n=1 Tax=Pistacia vera TaxID=55513 RepID=UPI001263E06A|nr:DELLA protein RGL2-like [Pistacia vera]
MDLNQPAPTESEEIQSEISNVGESEKERRSIFSLLASELEKRYQNRLKHLNMENLSSTSYKAVYCGTDAPALSTEEVMKVARARFSKYSPQISDNLLTHTNDLSDEDAKNVELAQLLFDSAEKVSNQQYDHARALLDICHNLSSITGNPVKRLVYYFVEALRERINRETGKIAPENDGRYGLDIDEALRSPSPSILACIQEIPFIKPTQFTAIQAVVEKVIKAKRVHVIDLEIKTGEQWTILMQAFATQHECPLELLKITAVVTSTSKRRVQKTGKSLMDFAKTVNVPLSFKTVFVSDFKDLKKDAFQVEAEEFLVVYSTLFFKSFLLKLDCLESALVLLKNLKPCIIVVSEIEANHNSQPFMDRFSEALFYYSAFFDGIDASMDQFNTNRICIELIYLSHMIRTIIATEGEERTVRHEKIDYWRAFFARFGIVETELSTSSLYQANLVVKKFSCGNSCTLTMNGKCLLIGWKGTPIFSVSVWKFQ